MKHMPYFLAATAILACANACSRSETVCEDHTAQSDDASCTCQATTATEAAATDAGTTTGSDTAPGCDEEHPLSGCPSGLFCADGVCCDSPCDRLCESCNQYGSEGRCTPLPDGDEVACFLEHCPTGTNVVSFSVNLGSENTIPAAFDSATPGTTSNFSSAITVYDSLGSDHRVDVYWRKSIEAQAGNTWHWFALVDGGELTGGTLGTAVICANGALTFDPSGRLATQSTEGSDFDFRGAQQNQVIAFSFGGDLASGGTGLNGSTQYAADSTVRWQEQSCDTY